MVRNLGANEYMAHQMMILLTIFSELTFIRHKYVNSANIWGYRTILQITSLRRLSDVWIMNSFHSYKLVIDQNRW